MSRTYKHCNKYKLHKLEEEIRNIIRTESLISVNDYYIRSVYINSTANKFSTEYDYLQIKWGSDISLKKRGYRTLVRRLERARNRVSLMKYINESFEDFEDSYYDDIQEQGLVDLDKYDVEEHKEWSKFIGNTWTLEDELEYCDKVFANIEEEIDKQLVKDVHNAFNIDTTLDSINKATIALKGCRAMQELWRKHGNEGRHKLLFDTEE